MVGAFRDLQSHVAAGGSMRAKGPPDDALTSPIARDEAVQQAARLELQRNRSLRPHRPPATDGAHPSTRRAPAPADRVARPAVHALEGADRPLREPVAERARQAEQPRGQHRRQGVGVVRLDGDRGYRAAPAAAATLEPPDSDDSELRLVGTSDDHRSPPDSVAVDGDLVTQAIACVATAACGWAGMLDVEWLDDARQRLVICYRRWGHGTSGGVEAGYLASRIQRAGADAPKPRWTCARNGPVT